MLAGIAIGVVEALDHFNYLDQPGLVDVLLLRRRARRGGAAEPQSRAGGDADVLVRAQGARDPRAAARRLVGEAPQRGRARRAPPRRDPAAAPRSPQPSRHLLYATIACFAICGLSVIVLTGWAGQLSLGQMAFAGLGALLAAALTRGLALDIGVRDTLDLARDAVPALHPPRRVRLRRPRRAHRRRRAARPGSAARGQHVRVRRRRAQYLYRQPVLSDGTRRRCRFPRGTLFGLDLSSQRTYYYVCLAVLVVALVVVSRLRRSGIGRTTIAVRDNADTGGGVHGRRGRVEAPRVRARRRSSPASAARCSRARSRRCRSPSATSWSATRSRSSRWW